MRQIFDNLDAGLPAPGFPRGMVSRVPSGLSLDWDEPLIALFESAALLGGHTDELAACSHYGLQQDLWFG